MSLPTVDVFADESLSIGEVLDSPRLIDSHRYFEIPNYGSLKDILSNPEAHIRDIFSLVDFFYRSEGIFGDCMDLMHEFVVGGCDFLPSKKYGGKFWEQLIRDLKLVKFLKKVALEYILKGNVIVYIYWNREKTLPIALDILNPGAISMTYMVGTGKPIVELQPTEAITKLRQFLQGKSTKEKNQILSKYPKDLREGLLRLTGGITLDPDNLFIIQRKKRDYDTWAVPFATRIFKDVILKNKLKEAEFATADGFVAAFWLFKIGNDKYPASKKNLQDLSNQMKNIGKHNRMVQGHTFQAEVVSPSPEIFSEEKYRSVNSDIIRGFGITRVFIDGEEGAQSSWYSILGFIERVQYIRDELVEAFTEFFEMIAERTRKAGVPKIRFSKNLRDPKVYSDIAMRLYEKGIISIQTLVEETGYDFELEIERKEQEEKHKDKFIPPLNPNNMIDPTKTDTPNRGRPRNSADPKPPNPQ